MMFMKASWNRMTYSKWSRSLSTGITYLPSVSFLIHQHKISNEDLMHILPTGPKNRLLKGDVLAFLKNGGANASLDSVFNESYHSIDIDLSNVNAIVQSRKDSSVTDLISLAALSSIQNVKDFKESFKSNDVYYTRKSIGYTFNSKVDGGEKLKESIFKKLKSSSTKVTPGTFRLIDSLALGVQNETETFHLQNGETAILSVNNLADVPTTSNNDVLDFLIGQPSATPSNSVLKVSEEYDLLDFLTPKASSVTRVRLELVVDERKVSFKSASNFLKHIKNQLEKTPNELIQ
ncbi:hypothetical protein BC833DRAFT_661074 [Globomyces pollinis-pini]|nr:hypothetical protein BC833DRAFT_661074 [Globomyces pollinis-pini]